MIDFERLKVELTSKPSDVNNRYFITPETDESFNSQPAEWEIMILRDLEARLLEEQRSRQLLKRNIFNQHYMCVNKQGAYEYLHDQPIGSCVFRPSPTGLDQLILTYKVRQSEDRW